MKKSSKMNIYFNLILAIGIILLNTNPNNLFAFIVNGILIAMEIILLVLYIIECVKEYIESKEL